MMDALAIRQGHCRALRPPGQVEQTDADDNCRGFAGLGHLLSAAQRHHGERFPLLLALASRAGSGNGALKVGLDLGQLCPKYPGVGGGAELGVRSPASGTWPRWTGPPRLCAHADQRIASGLPRSISRVAPIQFLKFDSLLSFIRARRSIALGVGRFIAWPRPPPAPLDRPPPVSSIRPHP
jgi:hypothetical protein